MRKKRKAEAATAASRAHHHQGLLKPAGLQPGHRDDWWGAWQTDRMNVTPAPSRALSSEITRSDAQGTVCSEAFFSSFSLNTDTLPPTRACSWELAGGKGPQPVHFTKPPRAGIIAVTTSKPRSPYWWHPQSMFLLPAHARQALCFCCKCSVTWHSQVQDSAASFGKRLNCCCYLSGRYISLGWRAIEETALVQTWNRFHLNQLHQQGLSSQEGDLYHHPKKWRDHLTWAQNVKNFRSNTGRDLRKMTGPTGKRPKF